MRNIFIILIFLCFSATHAANYYYPDMECKLIRVIDGDTIECNIPGVPDFAGRHISVRFRSADAPETRTKDLEEKKQGLIAKRNLERAIWARVHAGDKIILKKIGRGKYFRIIAHVYAVNKEGNERFMYVWPRK